MNVPNIVSVSFFPRYKMVGRHLEPVVVEVAKRVLWDNMTVDLTVISADEYLALIGVHEYERVDGK